MVGEKFSRLLESLGISKVLAAKELGVTKTAISDITNGRVQKLSGTMIELLKVKYNVNPQYWDSEIAPMFLAASNADARQRANEAIDHLGAKERKLLEELIDILQARPAKSEQYSHAESREVGLVASIAAGNPIEAIEHPEEVYLLPRKIFRQKGKLFLLKVRGDSMVGAGIFDGDLAVMERLQDAEQLRGGEIVAISLDGAATLKRFLRDNGSIILRAENSAYPDRVVTAREFPILWGRFVGLVRREVES